MPKLCWIRDHCPEIFDKADFFLFWADLVAFLLGGEAVASPSLACRSLLFDIHNEKWSDELIKLSGLEEVREKLAPIHPSATLIGTVDDGLAGELNLPKKVKIAVGGHDQSCNALGAGVCTNDVAAYGLGTFECITPVLDAIPPWKEMLTNGLSTEHHVLQNLYVTFLYNQGGSLVRWFRDTFAKAEAKGCGDIYDRLAGEMPKEPTDLIVLPYFDMTGPPEFITDASGAIIGLHTTTTRGEILKSIMESVTFYFADSIGILRDVGINPQRFIATGGGAKSDPWLQIKADILGVPFVRNEVVECSALGAAILGGIACGKINPDHEELMRFAVPERTFEPDLRRHDLYKNRLGKYQRVASGIRDFLRVSST